MFAGNITSPATAAALSSSLVSLLLPRAFSISSSSPSSSINFLFASLTCGAGSRFMSFRAGQSHPAAGLSHSSPSCFRLASPVSVSIAQSRVFASNFEREGARNLQQDNEGAGRSRLNIVPEEKRPFNFGRNFNLDWRADGNEGERLKSVVVNCSGDRGEGRFMSEGRVDWTEQDGSVRRPRWDSGGNFRRDGRVSRSSPVIGELRQWCSATTELPPQHESFVLVSYNILADKNASQHYNELYHHIPWWVIQWERRRTKLLQELRELSPDIMCLQEVDKFEDLRNYFEKRGYSSAYKGRTGGAVDGCAIFWKTRRFRLLQEESIQFNELNLRDNVAQLCVFQSVDEGAKEMNSETIHQNSENIPCSHGSLLVVGNIHVLFNPKRGDVKLGQLRILLESADALSKKWGGAPVTIAGDFNSTPMSDLYKFVSTSELDISCLNRTTMSGQVEARPGGPFPWMPQFEEGSFDDSYPTTLRTNEPEQSAETGSPGLSTRKWHWTPEEIWAATGTSDCMTLRHNLNLRSAYSQIKGEDGCRDAQGEPLVTTCHRKFMGTVDYVWHTEGIDTVRVLDTLPVKVLHRSQGLPSQKWGSDHLALVCELAFLPGFGSNRA